MTATNTASTVTLSKIKCHYISEKIIKFEQMLDAFYSYWEYIIETYLEGKNTLTISNAKNGFIIDGDLHYFDNGEWLIGISKRYSSDEFDYYA